MKQKEGGCFSSLIWKYDICIMYIVSAVFWVNLINTGLMSSELRARLLLGIYILKALTYGLFQQMNRLQTLQHWFMVFSLIIIKSIHSELNQVNDEFRNVVYTWQIQSLIELLIAQKLKHKLIIDSQRVLDVPLFIIALFIIVQQVFLGSVYNSTMFVTIPAIIYSYIMHQQICFKIEQIILRKEFCYQYINRSDKNTVFFNYSNNQVQTQKQKILMNLNDITQSTSEKQEECGSSNYSNQLKKYHDSLAQKLGIEENQYYDKNGKQLINHGEKVQQYTFDKNTQL